MEARILISLRLGALVLWILSPFQPEVPYLNFNDELLANCEIENSQSSIRLYRGSGGAGSSFWWKATVQTPGSEEHKFFRSFDSPAVESISCSKGAVTLKPINPAEKEITFTYEQVEGLKEYPIEFFDGKI
jgi:hypothetical protein